ncbi:MAG: 50S ribosomal protein L19 [Phycisphaerae bacterium]|jgi:large subunit ribosomal protein L19|nr:50S ribosomal protein L19 [Phycisphaerae bacterium]
MRKKALEIVEAAGGLKAEVPVFEIGDTVEVGVRVVEGEKERVQTFSGTVIARRGVGINEMFTVRRIVAGEGVERTFPLHGPSIEAVKVTRHGKVRRAKLYYLRDRIGKARRLRERFVTSRTKPALKAAAAPPPADAEQAKEAEEPDDK